MAGRDPLISGGACERVREWTSLRLDGELSPLEEELLERHLESCAECRVFEYDVRWATDVLRLTPQERPSRRVTIPAPERRVSRRRLTAVAAAAALALGALVGALVEGPASSTPADEPREISFLTGVQQDADDFRELPRTRILSPVQEPADQPNPPEGVI
jgi:ferric-dicitrate binding protein FerR (iron transport regulator)